MPVSTDIIVIGSGGLGSATAFYLSRVSNLHVTLIDRHAIGSQTSPRAAGMVSCLRKSPAMIDLVRNACGKIETFAETVGEPLDWVHSGSLKIARRPEDAEVLVADVERGQRAGLDVEQITVEEACRRHPFLQPDGIVAAIWIGEDRYFDPAQVAVGYARAAARQGVEVLPETAVLSVDVDGGRVRGVVTSRGTIECPVVVDAAGAWTREIAALGGIDLPLVPTRQQLIVTEPLAGAAATLPMVRIMAAAVSLRPCHGGFLGGVYEETPLFFDLNARDSLRDIKAMPLDIDVLKAAAADVFRQAPILTQAAVREFRGGIPTMTADGQHCLGPVPGIEGFYVASGCNVAGLSIAPALGEALATWIVDGTPPIDLSSMSISRFAAQRHSETELRQLAAWQYRHFYGAV